jgi:hypothetical protein
MITKKVLYSSSCALLAAFLLSQIHIPVKHKIYSEVNYTAFVNLASNVQAITAEPKTQAPVTADTTVTNDIIKVIDKEVSGQIKHTRHGFVKPKIKNAPVVTVVEKLEAVKPDAVELVEQPVVETLAAVKKSVEEIAEEKEVADLIAEDLTKYEIDNKDAVALNGFAVERNDYSTFENIKLAASYNEVIKDEVVVGQASTEDKSTAPIEADEVKTIQPATTRQEVVQKIKEEAGDDLTMFDYSDKAADKKVEAPTVIAKQSIDQKLYERPLSKTVQQAINREMGSAPIKKLAPGMSTQRIAYSEPAEKSTTRIDDQEIDLNSDQNLVFNYTKDNTPKVAEETEAFAAETPVNTHETQFVLVAKEINLSTQKVRQSYGYEFVPDYDRAERMDDQTSGVINLGYSLSGEMNTQTGVIQAQGMIPTRVELNLGTTKGLEVPLINEAGIQKFFQKQNLSIEGNLLMIALDPSIADTEIDSTYAQKILLDKNFKLATAANGASYVLFVGVKTGNILVRYLLTNKESAQKILYVGDGEMAFESPNFSSSQRETYTFTTRNLLGQKKKELIISGDAISFFNTTNNAKKKALNAYEIKVPTLVSGMRKYLEFKHLKDSIFVGAWNEKDIEVPSNEFIGKVLEVNQVNSLKERCVVQLNLSKDLREIKANGKNRSGEMFVETTFLDKDGNFSRDNSELAEKAFIVGDMEGLFNVKLEYTDGSTEFLKSFCSEGSYLVEQL